MDEKASNNYYVIDVMHILKMLWHRVWILVIASILAASVGFCIASFATAPTYSSSILLYVNSSTIPLGSTKLNISASELNASQSLVKTYGVLLKNRTTLERVIEKSGVNYSWKTLSGMITCGSSNETEVMFVKVTSNDPYEASKIANCIAEVLPERISEIISGATMEVVDSAIPNLSKISPSITKYTAVGFMVGLILSAGAITFVAILDNTIHDEDYVTNTYDYPILAKVPDLLDSGSKKYGYYKKNYYSYKDYTSKNKGEN